MQEALWHLRWQIGGYAVLLLAFWVWLLWTDHQAAQRSKAAVSNASDLAADADFLHKHNAQSF